jgi:hypothetical protein
LPPHIRGIWQFLLTRQYTNVADVNIAYRLASDLHPAVPVLRIARHMRARDFRNGNFVILGSDASNPWHQLFVEQLNFRFHPEPGANSSLRNLYPRAGEPERYMPAIPDGEESFGLIAMVPNTTGTGKVVLIAGLSMEATEACGDFVLRRETRGALLRALGVASEAELDRFEVVVRTTAVAGTGRTAQVIASRRNAPPAR